MFVLWCINCVSFYFHIYFYRNTDSRAVTGMPPIVGTEEYRIWSVINRKCLVLKKKDSKLEVTCTGTGDENGTGEEGTSKLQLFVFVVFACSLAVYFTI